MLPHVYTNGIALKEAHPKKYLIVIIVNRKCSILTTTLIPWKNHRLNNCTGYYIGGCG